MSDNPESEHQPNFDAVRSLAAGWIASADLKATALLAVAGALLAAVAFASTATTTRLEDYLVLLFCLATIGSIAASVFVLWPRTNRAKLLSSEVKLERSYSYFGDLGGLKYDKFISHLQTAKTESLRQDAREQCYVTVRIATRKMFHMRLSLALLVASLVLLAAFVSASAFELGTKSVPCAQPADAATTVLNPPQVQHGSGSASR